MHVAYGAGQYVRGVGQRQIVGGDDAQRAAFEQRAQQAVGADAAIVRVRSFQQLIEEEEHALGIFRQIEYIANAQDFGVETRAVFLQRIHASNARSEQD